MKNKEIILEVKGLKKYYPLSNGLFKKKDELKAVDDVSFRVYKGETLGIVGESGCGKSTLARTILKLYDATDGQILYNSKDITKVNKKELRDIRKEMQIVFQDPYSSLNPKLTVEELIVEPLEIHKVGNYTDRKKRVLELLDLVGLSKQQLNRYPHEFSGGQRQRIGIARSLALNPKLLICDEPVSALDVSIQSQILNLLKDLQQHLDLTYIFIAHDLSVVKYISDRVAVMYLGKIVEIATSDELYANAVHPYTKALLSAIPKPNPHLRQEKEIIKGDIVYNSPIENGCSFYSRCKKGSEKCLDQHPKLELITDNHLVSCYNK